MKKQLNISSIKGGIVVSKNFDSIPESEYFTGILHRNDRQSNCFKLLTHEFYDGVYIGGVIATGLSGTLRGMGERAINYGNIDFGYISTGRVATLLRKHFIKKSVEDHEKIAEDLGLILVTFKGLIENTKQYFAKDKAEQVNTIAMLRRIASNKGYKPAWAVFTFGSIFHFPNGILLSKAELDCMDEIEPSADVLKAVGKQAGKFKAKLNRVYKGAYA